MKTLFSSLCLALTLLIGLTITADAQSRVKENCLLTSKMLSQKSISVNTTGAIVLARTNISSPQLFNLKVNRDGLIQIESVAQPGMMVTVVQISTQQGGKLALQPQSNKAAQQFKVVKTREGFIMIESVFIPNMVLDITAGPSSTNTEIRLGKKTGSDAQQFKIKEIPTSTNSSSTTPSATTINPNSNTPTKPIAKHTVKATTTAQPSVTNTTTTRQQSRANHLRKQQ